jgi:hypothetical protein
LKNVWWCEIAQEGVSCAGAGMNGGMTKTKDTGMNRNIIFFTASISRSLIIGGFDNGMFGSLSVSEFQSVDFF